MDSLFPRLILVVLLAVTAVGVGHQGGPFADTAGAPWHGEAVVASDGGLRSEFPVSPLLAGDHQPSARVGTHGANESHGTNKSRAGTTQRLVTIDDPGGVYVLGSRETVRGTAPSDVETVAVYVRSGDDWQLLDLNADGERSDEDSVVVEADGQWQTSAVTLSSASNLLTGPGVYEIGAVAASDALDENGTLSPTLSPGAFSAGRSARTVVFARPAIASEPLVFEDVADQVAVEDGFVTVRGVATGVEEVLVFVVDGRGKVASDIVSVDDDGVFESEFDLVGSDGDRLARGFAVGQVLHAGRDGRVGDGEIQDEPAPGLSDLQSHLRERIDRARERGAPLTQAQVLRIAQAETVDDTASDDIRVVDTFTITDALTTIGGVYPANATDATDETDETGVAPVAVGEAMAVRGRTNRRPNDTTLFVDLVDPASGRPVAGAETDAWGLSGNWQVTISTAGLDPGNYTVRVDDGDDQDVVPIRVVSAAPSTSRPANQSTATPSVE